jgi:hypothetical protein
MGNLGVPNLEITDSRKGGITDMNQNSQIPKFLNT